MTTRVPHTDSVSLANTLLHALEKCKAQVKLLEERAQTIVQLQQENEQLKKELNILRGGVAKCLLDPYLNLHLNDLFYKDVEKQFQIDELRRELRSSKPTMRTDTIRRFTSTPSSRSELDNTELPCLPTEPVLAMQQKQSPSALMISTSISNRSEPKASHILSESTDTEGNKIASDVLREISPNIFAASNDVHGKRKRKSFGGSSAINTVAEDGEGYARTKRRYKSEDQVRSLDPSVYHRLDDLLAGKELDVAGRTDSLQCSDGKHFLKCVSDDSTFIPSATDKLSPHAAASPSRTIKQSPSSSVRQDSDCLAINYAHDVPKEAGSAQDNSIDERNLEQSNCKIGVDDDYRQAVKHRCVAGCARSECLDKKFAALAATLPKHANDTLCMSDDALLRQLFGDCSDERIRGLSLESRDSLLRSAWMKLAYDKFGKKRNRHQRQQSPTGFWNVDMPETQEEASNSHAAEV